MPAVRAVTLNSSFVSKTFSDQLERHNDCEQFYTFMCVPCKTENGQSGGVPAVWVHIGLLCNFNLMPLVVNQFFLFIVFHYSNGIVFIEYCKVERVREVKPLRLCSKRILDEINCDVQRLMFHSSIAANLIFGSYCSPSNIHNKQTTLSFQNAVLEK